MFDRIAPLGVVGLRRVGLAAYDRIAEKVRQGDALSDVEVEFLADAMGSSAKKRANLERIVNLSRNYVDASPPLKQLTAGLSSVDASTTEPTSEDWCDKFREDAGLVNDEVIQELYARILAEEAQVPGTVPLRVLAAMRYLDRGTAETFARLALCVFDGRVAGPGEGEKLHNNIGITLNDLGELEAAGLIVVQTFVVTNYSPSKYHVIRLPVHEKVVHIARKSGDAFGLKYNTYGLTQAGNRILKAVQRASDPASLEAILRWLVADSAFMGTKLVDLELHVADLPSREWGGPISDLTWSKWES